MRILVVEDEKKTALFLRKGLAEHGFVVDVAERGDDGLHLALTGEHDLLVLDVLLPGRDGWSVLAELRATCEFFEAAAQEAGIALRADVPEPVAANVDRMLLQRALGNLVSNALAYTPRGGTVTLAVRAEGCPC